MFGDQAVLVQLADVAVQVGGLDVEFRGDVFDGDPWTVLDQPQDVLLAARLAVSAWLALVRRRRRAPMALPRACGGGLRGPGACIVCRR
jgi:hypothetical protein